MKKTRLTVVTALLLTVISVALALGRWQVLGADLEGARGESYWKVTLWVKGELTNNDATVTVLLPPAFRHQAVRREEFQSQQLTPHVTEGRGTGRREVVWRPGLEIPPAPGLKQFRLTCTFWCVLGLHEPSLDMRQLTEQLERPSAQGISVRARGLIAANHKDIVRTAQELGEEEPTDEGKVRAFFDFVTALDNASEKDQQGALECLANEGGDSGGKSRLLVALCRSADFKARLVSGLVLEGDRPQTLHHWAEVWVNKHWLPMCPTYNHFGAHQFPKNYLVLAVGDEDPVRVSLGGRIESGYVVKSLHGPGGINEDQPASVAQKFWRQLSLTDLRPRDRQLVEFLLLLPLGALIVSVCRTVIGIPTFGTFSPALVGLAFLDLQALRWGLAIFVLTVLVGWGMRHLVENYHLLQVPRTAVLLTLIVLFLIGVILGAHHFGVIASQVIRLFPLVILTHLVERFWTVEAEDGTSSSFKTLVGTLAVAVTVSLALSPKAVAAWMLLFPETLGIVLAALLLLGRYTGYRLSELYRFGDLLREETVEKDLVRGGR